MRSFYILSHRLRTHFKEHCFVMIFFLLGIFFSALFLIYYYGDFVKSSRLIGSSPEIMSTYTLNFSEEIPFSDERIGTAENYGTITLYRSAYIDKENSSDFLIYGAGARPVTVMAKKGDVYSHSAYYGSTDLSFQMECIVLSRNDEGRIYSTNKLKETKDPILVYDGIPLKVIGIHNMAYESCIPYALFEEKQLPVNRLDIQLPEYLSQEDSVDFCLTLRGLFPEAEVIDPYDLYSNFLKAETEFRPTQMLIAMGLMLLSVFTFMFLAKYLFDMSLGENVVYRIVGADRSDVTFLALGEVLLLSFFSIVSAVAVHILLYPSLFSELRLYKNQTYTAQDYLIVAAASLTVCLVSCLPFLISVWRKSVMQLKTNVE